MGNKLGYISIAALGALCFSGVILSTNNKTDLTHIRAEGNNIVLNRNNAPTLSNGSGSIVDNKGVTWEYYNATDYSSGHVTLNHQGYFGIANNSAWGYTGINELSVNFNSTDGDELWLLKSTDGINWNEDKILTSNTPVESANNWRYIRFYNYSNNSTSVDINSVSLSFSCSGLSATEDIDAAHIENVVGTSTNITYTRETVEISPNSIGGEAMRFTKSGSGSTTLTLGLGKTYTIGEIQNSKIEFDMKTSNINYGKTLTLMHDTSSISSTVDSSKHSAYKCTNITDDWYHIEVPVTSLISTISGYGSQDIPAKNIEKKEVNAIKINAGTCVIDNLKIGSTSTPLGIYNNGTSFSSGSVYWFKVAWVGKLHSCTMTFDNPIAEQVSTNDPNIKNGSPFYIRGLSSGTINVTAQLIMGYDRHVLTIQKTLTVN